MLLSGKLHSRTLALLSQAEMSGTNSKLIPCIAVEGTRIREGIRDFAVDCSHAGRSAASTHYLYVNGMSPVGEPIETKEHLQRGKSLDNLTKMWLFTWGQDHID